MKNKKVTVLAMMMTMCMLGNSAAGAAEFSSGPSSVTDASESDSVENSNVKDADQPDRNKYPRNFPVSDLLI